MRIASTTALAVCLVFLTLAPRPAAQAPAADREAVLAVVQKFFDAIAAHDSAAGRAVTLPEGRFYALGESKAGEPPTLRTFTHQEWYERLGSEKRTLLERMWNPEVRIQGAIAVVWTPYDFWVDGKFSHCGVDAFNLVKTAEGWKISGGSYTVERTGCAPSPLGPPGKVAPGVSK